MDEMTPTDKLRNLLDERGIEWWPDKYYKETNTVWRVGNFEWCASEQKDGRLLIGCTCIETMTTEQAIAATVGAEPDGPNDGECYLMYNGKKYPAVLDFGFLGLMPITIDVGGFRYLVEVPNEE